MLLNLGPDLETLKAEALAQIDAEAETARMRFITPGAGQNEEYRKTETEARAYLTSRAKTTTAWPYLTAEQTALASINVNKSLKQIAMSVIAQTDAWATAGALIKELRRTAKLKVSLASNAQDVRNATQIDWPEPSRL